MKKCILVVGFMVVAGCSSEAVKWVNAGTLVSVGPDVESNPRPGRVKSAILGETNLNSTRVETIEGVYIVSEKISVVEPGIPVSVGYNSSDESQDTPSYLAFGGLQYKIAR